MTRAFVIGHPIAHSRSPLIHGHWLKTYGIPGSYEAIDVTPEALPQFFDRIRAGEFAGGNVTVPHKEAAFALCDFQDVDTCHLKAFNTLSTLPTSDGLMVYGQNTDLVGFLANLDAAAPGWDEGRGRAIVLGAGGAARAVAAGLALRMGEVHVLNRTRARAEALVDDLAGGLRAGDLDDFAHLAESARLVVNTTTLGMHGTRFEGIDFSRLPRDAVVTDIVYVPLETPFLAEARRLGLRTVDGLGMLLHQAAPGFALWFGVEPEVTADLRRLIEATL
ncbi:shikimate dehydrogenase [Devosia enhydra]|uniref:Shikimate dehydrogenase (NADP(+)) n=1 Tax=Devosia enhydra TaxID=665118 RepID=A0A1K2HYJ7_9HYPH|nr:shikimate dehydrogenase [Devosia enhydra]SFZ85065.1 shikimate dehydrogenase [Devosia enhydra]